MLAPILCPIDFSDCSQRALEHAVELATTLRTTVTVLHVVEPPDPLLQKQEYVEYLAQQYRAPLHTLMHTLRSQYPTVIVSDAVVLEGKPAKTIVDFAAQHNHGLVVVGTHGRTGIAHAVIGSVAERVVRTARVPVLTIPPPRSGVEDGGG